MSERVKKVDGGYWVSEDEWRDIQEQLRWLECLESAGVDNWSGIDYAREEFNESEDEED